MAETPMSTLPNFAFPNPIIPPRNSHLPRGSICNTKNDGSAINDGPDYLRLILNARVYDVATETPLTLATKLTAKLQNKILLKREDMQANFSFKCRGAYNRMYQLNAQERAAGVICVSAGNHAQGVALAAKKLGIKATIVMPAFAPEIKVESVRRLGAEIVLTGNDFDEAKKECARLAKERGSTFIPPFDDPYVIAGQGTVGVEILRQLKQDRLDAIFVCCGGGGLLAGIAVYIKRIRPEVRVIGVNTIDSDSMYQSLNRSEPVEISSAGLFSDGTSVRLVGNETYRLCKMYVDDMILVSTDEICAAIKDTFEDTRSIVEPAGALGVAGVKKYIQSNPQIKDGVFVAVLSGANMNFDRLRFVAERARVGEGRETLLSVVLPERPGSFLELYSAIHPTPVTECSYRYNDPKTAHFYLALDVKSPSETEAIIHNIAKKGFEVIDITENELAKAHARFMVGGRSSTVIDERLYRFRFIERHGALKRFLETLEGRWNLSLFHYRNLGGDTARVLVGMQVPKADMKEFSEFLTKLGYESIDETDNAVYKHFLM